MSATDGTRLLGLLKAWHKWAAGFSRAPGEVECPCGALLAHIHEPDAVGLPDEPRYLAERDAFKVVRSRYMDNPWGEGKIGPVRLGNDGVYAAQHRQGGKPMPDIYRLALPCRLICWRCDNIIAVNLLRFAAVSGTDRGDRVKEMRKYANRLPAAARDAVESEYRAWHSGIGGRLLSFQDTSPPWPYGKAEEVSGPVEYAQRLDDVQEDSYTSYNSQQRFACGGFHSE